MCDREQVSIDQREDGVRNAAGSPELVEISKRTIDERPNGLWVPDRSDSTNRLAGVFADELRRGATQLVSELCPTLIMSTRCAPLVMINSGSPPSVAKINELAIAPTEHPRYRAAAGAVATASSSMRTRPGKPAASRMRFTASQLGCI